MIKGPTYVRFRGTGGNDGIKTVLSARLFCEELHTVISLKQVSVHLTFKSETDSEDPHLYRFLTLPLQGLQNDFE